MIRTKQHSVTHAGLSQLVDVAVTWSPQPGIMFTCIIIDARTAWNRIDVLIEPIDGEGQVWVSAASVQGISPQGQEMIASL